MWQVTCVKHTMKAALPFSHQVRTWWRRSHPTQIGPQHESVVEGGFDHVRMLRKGGLALDGSRILEIGSGWFPIIPLMLRVAGARTVYMADAYPLLDAAGVRQALAFLSANESRISSGLEVGCERMAELVAAADRAEGKDLPALLEQLGIVYLAPFDVEREMPVVDAIVSHTALEHIPPSAIEDLVRAVHSGLRKGGLMSHGIDNTDHRAHNDRRLSRFDFLKYDGWVWRLFCLDPQDYTNRLRHSEYMALFERNGHRVIAESTFVDRRAMASLTRARLAAPFKDRPREDLATAWSHILTRSHTRDDWHGC
ncbi:SAM-dependent methyltransferase [Sphingomonas sp. S2-65]|uniref:SAM-dependent methyltransferase n=1 Tax=Sphingomonas sp. S2-65 TaxID=2903960 RepID=UPI001F411290|nr:class I SAM-dependent methyltransferase [Sphingomonas sp. S2-65]UYY57037.1 class I SAM-dependent methyltransferase [Sphingomonas sp. S2-65]